MVGVLLGVVGLLVGAVATFLVLARRIAHLRARAQDAEKNLAVRETELESARSSLTRVEEDHRLALENLREAFANVSTEVLEATAEKLHERQSKLQALRDEQLGLTLRPLEGRVTQLLDDIKNFSTQHAEALSDVKNRATELLASQVKAQAETQRLNQLLGRSDQRGHWGEIQLANVMNASGLRPVIDYDLQVTSLTDLGKSQRPDCVVNMPNGDRIAVDAKFPFDAFEAALRTENPAEREAFYASHAAALRGHVKKLGEKAYWEAVAPSPSFVVCFVPSDAAIAKALEADPGLYDVAVKERVLLAGPTNLLSLLWTVAQLLRQHQASVNAEEILAMAAKLYDRMRVVAGHVVAMGKSINATAKSYNDMVGSMESRLIVTAKGLRNMGAARHAEELPDLGAAALMASPINEERWGVDDEHPLVDDGDELLVIDATED